MKHILKNREKYDISRRQKCAYHSVLLWPSTSAVKYKFGILSRPCADYQGGIVICGRAKELVALKFVHINRVWPRVSVPPATSDPDENSP